jgi:hypothetical protein
VVRRTYRVLCRVRHAREGGFLLRLILKVDNLLNGIIHEFLGGFEGHHAGDGQR